VSRRKAKSGRLSVFKGREARLNKVIFYILALKGPPTIYETCKEVRAEKGLKQTKYTNVNRRIRTLEQSGYLEKAGRRKTLAGFEATLYQLSAKGYLALKLNQTDIETLLQNADETAILTLLATLSAYNLHIEHIRPHDTMHYR
jgi:hypothetical protein